jgi:ADP-heptose:LPS heptosyltransferase
MYSMPQKDEVLRQSKKVLIIKGPGIGDVVTTIPLAKNFKKLGFEVHVLEEFPPKKQGIEILTSCPYIDKIVSFDYSIHRLNPKWGKTRAAKIFLSLKFISFSLSLARDIKRIRGEKYDLIFEGFPGSEKTLFLSRLARPRFKACCSSHPKSGNYDIVLPIQGKNIVEIENSIFDNPDSTLEIFNSNPEADKKADEMLIGRDGPFVCITTGHSYKKWENEKWAELIDSMPNATCILIGDNEQEEDAHAISKLCKSRIMDLCGKLTLDETISIMRKMNVFFCTNGGLMWISCALKKPTVVVSGETPYWWDPKEKNSIALRIAPEDFYSKEMYAWKQDAKTSDISVADAINAAKTLFRGLNDSCHNNMHAKQREFYCALP